MTSVICPRCERPAVELGPSRNYPDRICKRCRRTVDGLARKLGAHNPIEHQGEDPPANSSPRKEGDLYGSLLDVSMGTPARRGHHDDEAGGSTRWLGQDLVEARARVLNIRLPLGTRGPCVLPGHGRHHGAAKQGRDDKWGYWCSASKRWFTFADVRAMRAYADVPLPERLEAKLTGAMQGIRLPGSTEVSRWGELLDYEAGLRQPSDVRLWRPPGLKKDERVVLDCIELMLALRDERWAGQPFTWARRMSRARTGLSTDRARTAIEGLLDKAVLVKLEATSGGQSGRANLYRQPVLIEALGSLDAVVQEVISEFDAELLDEGDG